MAPSVLGIGISHTSPLVPEERRNTLQKALESMDADMKSSPYDWELYYIEPDIDFDLVIQKLQQKPWDVVMIGGGLRMDNRLTVFFEKIVNAVHKELPRTKFAFNASLNGVQGCVERALNS